MSYILFTKFSFIQLSRSQRRDFPKSFHEYQYDGWSNRMPTIVSRYSKARWLRPAFAESYRLLCVTLSKELVAVHVWNALDQWHNWRVAGVRTAFPPAKLNVKTGPLPSLYFGIIYYSCGFSRFLFFCVFRSVFRWFRVFV